LPSTENLFDSWVFPHEQTFDRIEGSDEALCLSGNPVLFGAPAPTEGSRGTGHQLLRSGTSVAAHAREASRARSDAEFCSKLDGLLQEADESSLWIELLRDDCNIHGDATDRLYQESNELIAIFATITSKLKRRNDREE
jgi:four helix bundle protein